MLFFFFFFNFFTPSLSVSLRLKSSPDARIVLRLAVFGSCIINGGGGEGWSRQPRVRERALAFRLQEALFLSVLFAATPLIRSVCLFIHFLMS